MSLDIQLTVNREQVREHVEPGTLLVDFLRDKLRLTGTHIGCDTGQCGACVVHVDGDSVKSCAILAVQANGANVTTIEGLGDGDHLHPMQLAFLEHHALQCGYCTPGMIMSALDFVSQHPDASREEIRQGIAGNICRCTGYENIVSAISAGAEALKAVDA